MICHVVAEPKIPTPPVRRRSLPELLSSLQAEPEHDDEDTSCISSVLPLITPDPILTQALTVEAHTAVHAHRAEVDTTEQLTPLSLTQIDGEWITVVQCHFNLFTISGHE